MCIVLMCHNGACINSGLQSMWLVPCRQLWERYTYCVYVYSVLTLMCYRKVLSTRDNMEACETNYESCTVL